MGKDIHRQFYPYISRKHSYVVRIFKAAIRDDQTTIFAQQNMETYRKREKTPIYKVTTTSGDNIVQYDPIGTPEDIKLCDVSYLRQHSLALDEKRLSEIKCKEIKNILSDCSMLGMVKHSAWEYEKETRLCIVLPPNSEQRYPDKIAIDFDGIHGATVMGSPCIDPERIQETLDGLKQEFIGVNKQKQIINSIQFDVADTKHCVSALKDKLYLPTFCSFCTKQSKCNLYKTINVNFQFFYP